jgi:hypothetical protein
MAFNNHDASFEPKSATTFLKMIDKPYTPEWIKEIQQNQKNGCLFIYKKHQTSLFDYPSLEL